jgi:hypothetical protein
MNNKFWNEVTSLINSPPNVELEYRLYYNELGNIIRGTQIVSDESDDPFVVVTKEQYESYFNYRVVNNKLKKIDRDPGYRVQLVRGTSGYPTVYGHASLLIEPGEEYNNIEYYDRNN